MTIDIGTLNQEQQDALTELLADYNAALETPVTAEQYLAAILTGSLEAKMAQRYTRAMNELGDAARAMDYAARQGLIAQVRTAIGG